MRFPLPSRFFGRPLRAGDPSAASEGPATPIPWLKKHSPDAESLEPESTLLQTLAWISAGVGALALGLVVGREIRQRYKFTRRTPYDLYAHAGDEHDMEFGVGI